MGIVLKGLEIENFKSYREKQKVNISDLSVLLGANSSGKSTAVQALLLLKQTMECNSPDEELLLSGKYVALGDYDDVISDDGKEFFSIAVILDRTGESELAIEDDEFKISWVFKRGADKTSAILSCMEIVFENIKLSFRRTDNDVHHMYIDDERSEFSVRIENLQISEFILHYDIELNNKAASLLNDIMKLIVSKKVSTVPNDRPVCINEIENFYFRLIERIQTSGEKYTISLGQKELAEKLRDLIDNYGELELSRYKDITRLFPSEICAQMLAISFTTIDSTDCISKLIVEHQNYLIGYSADRPSVESFGAEYSFGKNLFRRFDADESKEDNITQLKYALDFYDQFYSSIIQKMFFVGPIRETPQGLYNIGFETIPKYVGPTGSYFASVLLHETKKEREYILPDRKEVCTLSEALAAWMIHLNIASGVNVDKKNSFGFSVSIENMEQVKSDIMNVGIGTSQVLPVLISVLLSEPGEILLFEQPELHLHPYSQSRLADMFTEFCKHGRKIILETHSEYFLLRLRYYIVREQYSENAAAINFFQNKGGTKVWFANISGYGNIDYPEDFRDETQILLDAILDAALERKGWS